MHGLRYTDATITVNAASPVEIYSALEQAGEIDIRGDISVWGHFEPAISTIDKTDTAHTLRRIKFTSLIRATKIDVVPDSKVNCSANLIHAYRNINYPDEPSFCDAESLALGGKTVYTYKNSATPSATSSASYNPRASHNPKHSPRHSPTSSKVKLGAGYIAGIVVTAVVIGGIIIGGFIKERYQKRHMKRESNTGVTTGLPTASTGAAYDADATGGLSDVLPQHSADEAPPPYSKAPPPRE